MPFLRLHLQLVVTLLGTALRTTRGGRPAGHSVAPPASGPVCDARRRHQFSTLLRAHAPGVRPTIERLGARRGSSPAARDGRRARLRACATRRDLPDVRPRCQLPARPGRAAPCRASRSSAARRTSTGSTGISVIS